MLRRSHCESLPGRDTYTLVCGRKVTIHSSGGSANIMAALNLPSRALCVLFKLGDAPLTDVKVTIHSSGGSANIIATLNLPSRALCVLSQHDDVLLTGLEDGSVKLWDFRLPTTSGAVATISQAHSSRIRGMASVKGGAGEVPEVIATGSSDGFVKVWDTRMLGSKSFKAPPPCVAEADTRARITCLCARPIDALCNQPKVKAAKPKQEGASAEAVQPVAGQKQAVEPAAGQKQAVQLAAGQKQAVQPAAGQKQQKPAGQKQKQGGQQEQQQKQSQKQKQPGAQQQQPSKAKQAGQEGPQKKKKKVAA
eukprot:gene5251-18482_t